MRCLAALLSMATLAVPAHAQEEGEEGPEGGGRTRTNHWVAEEPAGRGAGPVTAEALAASPTRGDWLHFGGNFQSWRYSPIEELTPAALPRLRVAWAAQTGVPGQLEASPIVYDGVLYLTSSHNRVLAHDAVTGELLWRYDHQNAKDLRICCGPANRGVAIAGETVLMGTLDAKLVALDRRTGALRWETTIVDHAKGFSVTSAPLVVGERAFIGIGGGEYGVRGFFDAYDVSTGERLWRHHTVPAAGEPGVETWAGNSYESGGAPTWVTGSYDPSTDTLFWATGNPSPDWNGDVREGDNLFSDSVLAVDPATGERRWHFQFTPHDVWDYDGNTELFLVEAEIEGETVPLLAQANRNGYFYVLDRRDGRFLRATQYAHQVNWGTIDPNGRPIVDPGRLPQEEDPPRVCPGLAGGNNGAYNSAYSPKTGMIYVPVIESCMSFRKGIVVFIEGVPYVGGQPQRVDTLAGKSYGHLAAIDVATGETAWDYRDPESMMGGVLTTAGGVVITGNARGHVLGFDAETGEEVWRFNTGSGIRSHPIAYAIDGRVFVAVGSGGGGGVHYSTGASRMVPEGSTLFVFELPSR
jgi:alcohol dehydrogenase (cytochrome c)